MPELPEVETVKNGLLSRIVGQRIEAVALFRQNLRYPFPIDFVDRLQGQTIANITRRAKFLIFDLGGHGFLGHLGMTGSYRVVPLDQHVIKHDHFSLTFPDAQLLYNDPRRFGAVDLWMGDPTTHDWLRDLGDEPLGNGFNPERALARARASKTPIKSALLNQRFVAGIGNIYASEALWRARIHPETPAGALDLDDWNRLVPAIRDVLDAAIRSGGSTLRDFHAVDGSLGYFQHNFDVYERADRPCANRCGALIERIVQSGRASYFCPQCQMK